MSIFPDHILGRNLVRQYLTKNIFFLFFSRKQNNAPLYLFNWKPNKIIICHDSSFMKFCLITFELRMKLQKTGIAEQRFFLKLNTTYEPVFALNIPDM